MVVTDLGWSGNGTDGKDFTRIVLELIGALEQTIAVEPLNGWRGAKVNHSQKVLQWLLSFHFQGKCIEIHVGYEKETGKANRCGDWQCSRSFI